MRAVRSLAPDPARRTPLLPSQVDSKTVDLTGSALYQGPTCSCFVVWKVLSTPNDGNHLSFEDAIKPYRANSSVQIAFSEILFRLLQIPCQQESMSARMQFVG